MTIKELVSAEINRTDTLSLSKKSKLRKIAQALDEKDLDRSREIVKSGAEFTLAERTTLLDLLGAEAPDEATALANLKDAELARKRINMDTTLPERTKRTLRSFFAHVAPNLGFDNILGSPSNDPTTATGLATDYWSTAWSPVITESGTFFGQQALSVEDNNATRITTVQRNWWPDPADNPAMLGSPLVVRWWVRGVVASPVQGFYFSFYENDPYWDSYCYLALVPSTGVMTQVDSFITGDSYILSEANVVNDGVEDWVEVIVESKGPTTGGGYDATTYWAPASGSSVANYYETTAVGTGWFGNLEFYLGATTADIRGTDPQFT